MKKYRLFSMIVILVLLIVAAPAQAATMLTVDGSTGTIDYGDACPNPTSSAVYKSLQAAIDCAVDGDTIEVMDGTYGVTGQSSTCEYGFPAAIVIIDLDNLTIQAAPGHEPVVKPVTATEANIVSVAILNSNNLTINNIDSDQTIAQFDNWHVCDSNNLTVRNSHFEGGEDGIDFNTDLMTALIENNTFVDINTGSGDEVLDFTDASYVDVTIQDNLFQNNYRHITINPPSGKSASDFIIRRNIMDGTTSQEGVRFNDGGGPLDSILLENNVILNSTQQGLYVKPPVTNITVQYNTFFMNGEEEIRLREAAGNVTLKNNIIYANGTHAAISARSPFTPGPLSGEDFNLVYNNGLMTESGSAAPITGFGANTITGQDPLFVSTAAGSEDLHLQSGSPAIEAGEDLGVADDIEKNSRPNPTGTAPDIGAYEAGSFDDEGPLTTNVVADPNPVAVGSSVALTANVDDTDRGDSNIASAEYNLDGGSWNTMSASDGNFDEVSEDVTASFIAPSESGIYDLCVRGTDEPGNEGDYECIMLVVYDPDGGFVTGGGWIDSPAEAMTPISTLVWDQDFSLDDAGWFDNDDYAGYGYITASGGTATITGFADDCFSWVPNPPPVCYYGVFSRFDGYRDVWPGMWTAEIDVYLDPSWPSGQGFDYSVAANGSDGNHQRDYIFHVGVVDGYGLLVNGSNNSDYYTNPYKLVNDNGGNYHTVSDAGWYTLQHVFYDAGGYLAVDLNLLDANGATLWTATRESTVDTIPGEVGGNRYAIFTHVDVADGIQVDNHQLFIPVSPTGKATFGFVSKYKKGASVPTGNTEFQFKAGDLNFHSTEYQWLVINQGGTNAQFKGYGTINGEGTYKFQIWAGDNDPDTFRIKIWYEESGSEVVVYDNGMDQAIGGGSIVVHKK